MGLTRKFALAMGALLFSIPSAHALIWDCDVPEIDGPAGLSALAVLVSVGLIAYDRIKS